MWFAALAGCAGLAAAVAVGRWPGSRRMAWLIVFWLAAALGDNIDDIWPHSRPAVTLAMLATALQAPAYAQMVLAYPSGRLRDRLDRVFVAVAYALSVLWQLAPALFADFRCAGCSPAVPSLLFSGRVLDLTVVGQTFSALFIALGLVFLALVVRRARAAPPGALRTLLPLVAASVFAVADLIVARVASLMEISETATVLEWLDRATLLVLPAAIFAGIAAIRRDRGPLGDLVVELGAARPGEVRAALARAVGDPTLVLGLWLPERAQFADENGDPVSVEPAPGRAVTRIGPEDRPLAAIVHDARLVGQRELLEAAGSAALLALENARLQAELHAQLVRVDVLLHRPAAGSRLAELTAREREVLALVAQGLTDRGIAERLWLTPKTVETHVRHILAKLGLPADAGHNRRVLAVLAYLREDGG